MGTGNPKGTNRGGGPRPGTKKYHARPDGTIWVEHKRKCSLLKGSIGTKGYRQYTLSIPDGEGGSVKKTIDGHRFIAEQLLPNPDGLPQVDHINRVRDDNRLVNLRWVSREDNMENTVWKGTAERAIAYLEGLGYTVLPPQSNDGNRP